jgi:drug/metabolite transporter (DMT)-like permease
MNRPWLPYAVLAGGVLVLSTASILIRLAQAQGMPSLTIAAMRMGLAALILLPIAWPRLRSDLPRLAGTHLRLTLVSGACLAVHFWSWIASLAYTSVASSTVLVTTNPIWVGLASLLLLRERLPAASLTGIALSIGGTGLIFASDTQPDAAAMYPAPQFGNMLALVGAISASAYLLIGRSLRSHLGLLTYVWLAYATAAVLLGAGAVASGTAVLGFSPLAYAVVLALAVGPQLLGHTAFNWSLRHLSATFVALSILGEPVGSALLAYFIFGEKLAALQLAGFLLILAGIFVAARAEHRAQVARATA